MQSILDVLNTKVIIESTTKNGEFVMYPVEIINGKRVSHQLNNSIRYGGATDPESIVMEQAVIASIFQEAKINTILSN